jgi:hypothetical protein
VIFIRFFQPSFHFWIILFCDFGGVVQVFCRDNTFCDVFSEDKAAVGESEVFFAAGYVFNCNLVGDFGGVWVVAGNVSIETKRGVLFGRLTCHHLATCPRCRPSLSIAFGTVPHRRGRLMFPDLVVDERTH